MRRCGAEKLPWLVIEVEVGAERAGCFAERQLRLSLVGEEAIPETRDRLGRPAERTKARLRVRIGAVHETRRSGSRWYCASPQPHSPQPARTRRTSGAQIGQILLVKPP